MAGVRFEDVDLLGALSRIVDLHTQHYKEDFDPVSYTHLSHSVIDCTSRPFIIRKRKKGIIVDLLN